MSIKKIVIPRESLPDINTEINGYALRYRIVSEDKNKTSHWSNLQVVKDTLHYSTGSLAISKQSSHVLVIWDPVKIKAEPGLEYSNNANLIATVKEYDLWVRWSKADLGDWLYVERIEGSTATLIIPNHYIYNEEKINEKPNQIMVEIRRPSSPIARDYSAGLFYASDIETI